MASIRSFFAFSTITLALTVDAGRLPNHRHEAIAMGELQRRQIVNPIPDQVVPSSTPAASTDRYSALTVITPSPGGKPVTITMQSQEVTSYLPEYTICPLSEDSMASTASPYPISPSAKPTYRNESTSVRYRRQIAGRPSSCTTIYSSTVTPVCATVIDGIATKYSVSACHQYLTFSSQNGYRLLTASPTPSTITTINSTTVTAMITPAPTVQNLTTYYAASWQALTSAGVPEEVRKEICSNVTGSVGCSTAYERWSTTVVASPETSVYAVNFTTAISGPAQVIAGNFTTAVTASSTTLSVSTQVETVSNATLTRTLTAARSAKTGSTVYLTVTLENASTTPTGTGAVGPTAPYAGTGSSKRTTRTTTIHITSTITAGTTTITLPTEDVTAPAAVMGTAS